MAKESRLTIKPKTFIVTPTISATPYSAGDCVGGSFTVSSDAIPLDGRAYIEGVRLVDLSQSNVELDVLFFTNTPATTFTDNAELEIADADTSYVITIPITPSKYHSFKTNSIANILDISIPYTLLNIKTLTATIVSRGAVTYTDGDLILAVDVAWYGE